MEMTVKNDNISSVLLLLACLASLILAGCGGNKILKEPLALQVIRPLASTSDKKLEINLDWVIVRGGPGTWARNADWDEYMIRVRNLANKPVRITAIAIYDSLDTRLVTSGRRKDLVKGSKRSSRRYEDEGIKVKAGLGGVALMATGTAAYVAGMGLGAAALSGSVAASSATAAAAVGGIVLAPVLVVGGIFRSANNNKVAREISRRQTDMPHDIAPLSEDQLVFFFPLAPSPRYVELAYSDSDGDHVMAIDTGEVLGGLHIGNLPTAATPSAREAIR